MKMRFLPWFGVTCDFRNKLGLLLGGALLGMACVLATAQSVSFAGATPSVNFGDVNVCPAGKTTSVPYSQTMTLSYNLSAISLKDAGA